MNINKSKKYSSVYQPLLKRVYEEESVKYKKDKEIIKAVKNRLHTVYGAFFHENSVKTAEDLINSNDDISVISIISEKLLSLNTSSRERLPFIRDLYKFIFEVIGDYSNILDIGCGFNPFSLPYILEFCKNIKSYYAYDIDVNLAELINKYFDLFKLPQYAGCIDIITEIPSPSEIVDVAFLFKIIPTTETCKKGRGFEIINNINVKYLVVSFPTKTLCGKNNKGMEQNYANFFEGNLDYDKFKIIGKEAFLNELVYVLSTLSESR